MSTEQLAARVRGHALRMTHHANASHIGSCLSAADLIAVLYGAVLRHDPHNPDWDGRDHFILSKGHATAILYAVLAECGYFPIEWLNTYGQDGTCLPGHVTHHGIPGVELSTGSLGHGLSVGCGLALAARQDYPARRIYILLSDGELDEGSNWEAILFAGHHRLTNLVALVDYNKIQSFGAVHEVLDLHPLVEKWQSFGWAVSEIDGHNHQQILDALHTTQDRPHVVIAHTVKGKGVSFMENQLVWHYKSPNAEQLAQALHELGID